MMLALSSGAADLLYPPERERHPTPTMAIRSLLGLLLFAFAQALPAPVDTSKIGPQVGQSVPPIRGVDQFGKTQSLDSIYGPNGAMLVFFRSADW
jgi:hypothetical protein